VGGEERVVRCPACSSTLRVDDIKYGICWRCATLLAPAEPAPVVVDEPTRTPERQPQPKRAPLGKHCGWCRRWFRPAAPSQLYCNRKDCEDVGVASRRAV
jgi:hypothetical protein